MHLSSDASDCTAGVCAYCAAYVTTLRKGGEVFIKLIRRPQFETLPLEIRQRMVASRRAVIATWSGQ